MRRSYLTHAARVLRTPPGSEAAHSAGIAAPVCQGRRGHPVGFAARLGDELRALDGDEGARAVLARHRGVLLELAVDDDAGWQDIDTLSDLDAVNRRLGRP